MGLFNPNIAEKTYIASATTTQVATGNCVLHAIVVNSTTAFQIGIIDGTSGTTANVGIMQASIPPGTYEYNCVMKLGIRIVTLGASDITVIWSQS